MADKKPTIKQRKNNSKIKQTKQSQNKVKVKNKKADDKSARLKKMRKIKNFMKWTILIGIIVGILIVLCTSDLFGICNIEIVGNEQVSREQILEMSAIKFGDNIFLCNQIKTKNNLKSNPYVEKIKITRNLPDKIKIEITEKQKAYIIELDTQYAYIDNQGYVLEISDLKIDKPVLQGYLTEKENILPGNRLNEEDLERLGDILKIIKSSEEIQINDKIQKINMENKNNYILTLQELKKVIYIGDKSNLANKMLYIKAIIQREEGKEGKIFVNGKLNEGFEPYFREEPNN